MNFVRFPIAVAFLFVFALCSSAFASGDSIFYCNTPVSAGRTVPAGQRSLSPIALYACGTNASTQQLPAWWARIWHPDTQHSVPRFYRDNSLNQYLFNSQAFGLNDSLCFSFGQALPSTFSAPTVGPLFTKVMADADTLVGINFANFDNDGPNGIPASQDICCGGQGDDDGKVDGVFLMVVNHIGDHGFALLDPFFDYQTRDTAANGDTIFVVTEQVAVVKPSGRERAVALAAHEWGHVLNLPELYGGGWGNLNALGWWDLGSFSIMGTGFPGLKAVPFDPYSRIRLGWDTAITVNSPLYGRQIADYLTSGEIYKVSKSSTEYFLVTNHKGVIPQVDPRGIWEAAMPGIGGLDDLAYR
ncbi:MAG: hypothetical protein L0209_08945 [candidate division Zixibacteria bacterium]|nr:hypothetical protein [candidate division Zixibacteria bacterium]